MTYRIREMNPERIQLKSGKWIDGPRFKPVINDRTAKAAIKSNDLWLCFTALCESTEADDFHMQRLVLGMKSEKLPAGDRKLLNDYLFSPAQPRKDHLSPAQLRKVHLEIDGRATSKEMPLRR